MDDAAMTLKRLSLLVLATILILAASTAAFDPTVPTISISPNTTFTLLPLTCTLLTYTLPANHSLSISLAVSPPILALGYTINPTDVCRSPDTSGVPGYVQILNTLTTTPTGGVYNLRNITAERCWSKDVTLRISAATGWSAAYEREESELPKSVSIGAIEVAATGNRTCLQVDGTSPTGTTDSASATSTPSWGLLPPPPGTRVRENGAESSIRSIHYIAIILVLSCLGYLG
ncbi:hypothetical protein SpCBS45565_g06220 [Spizellomyces sp. 'palustris']|nr:hypothetical protein SpCBS45565_g06220 [Spizellomyces sp. 'palustris']